MQLNNTGQALFLLSEVKCHSKAYIYLFKVSDKQGSHLHTASREKSIVLSVS